MEIDFPPLSDGTIDGIICTFKYTSDAADDVFTCADTTKTSSTATPTADGIQNMMTTASKMTKEYFTESNVAYATLGAHIMRNY